MSLSNELSLFCSSKSSIFYEVPLAIVSLIVVGTVLRECITYWMKEGPEKKAYRPLFIRGFKVIGFVVTVYIVGIALFLLYGTILISIQQGKYESIKKNQTIDDVKQKLGMPDKDPNKQDKKDKVLQDIHLDIAMDMFVHEGTEALMKGKFPSNESGKYFEETQKYKRGIWKSIGLPTYIEVNFYDGVVTEKFRKSLDGEILEQETLYTPTKETKKKPEASTPRFSKDKYGIITDNSTGYQWIEEKSGRWMSWKNAVQWADKINISNTKWRLPTIKELITISNTGVLYGTCGKSGLPFFLDKTVFSTTCWHIWSSDMESNKAACFNFGTSHSEYIDASAKKTRYGHYDAYVDWLDIKQVTRGVLAIRIK